MRTTEPTSAQLTEFAETNQASPFTMVNLITFRAEAEYQAEEKMPKLTGREAYDKYLQVVLPKITALGGKLVYRQKRQQLFVGAIEQDCDEIIIVAYPSRVAYLTMFNSIDYQAAIKHRKAGLAHRVLFQCPANA